jgi:hypothetical protein
MGIYREIYEFAAKAGALEGYVYPKEKVEPSYLPFWVEHVVQGYRALPEEARSQFQEQCNGTIGRAVQSLLPLLGEDHEVIGKLRSIISGDLPSSPDDFKRQKP